MEGNRRRHRIRGDDLGLSAREGSTTANISRETSIALAAATAPITHSATGDFSASTASASTIGSGKNASSFAAGTAADPKKTMSSAPNSPADDAIGQAAHRDPIRRLQILDKAVPRPINHDPCMMARNRSIFEHQVVVSGPSHAHHALLREQILAPNRHREDRRGLPVPARMIAMAEPPIPNAITSPTFRFDGSTTRLPFKNVPFVEFISLTRQCRPEPSIKACCAETKIAGEDEVIDRCPADKNAVGRFAIAADRSVLQTQFEHESHFTTTSEANSTTGMRLEDIYQACCTAV